MNDIFVIDQNTPLVMRCDESEAVHRAFNDLQNDLYSIFGMPPHVTEELPEFYNGNAIYIGRIAEECFTGESIAGRECYRIEMHENIITLRGSDELGLIFAIYRFCEEILGVDPWYFWNDILPEKRKKIEVARDFLLVGEEPSFRYRGFFINNEDLLVGSFRDPHDENQISAYHFEKICELILRLYGNTIAPGTRIYPDETSRDIANIRGLYGNDHHVTPLGLNVYTWPKELPFSYVTHPEILEKFWKQCIDAQKHRKMLWTVSFRGKGDGPFWEADPAAPVDDVGRADVINRAVAKQVEMIREVQPEADIIFNMYFEQAELYKKGLLKIPDGVIKVWPNDGAGVMSDDGQSGVGDGAYYHVSACRNRICEVVSPEITYRELGGIRKRGGNGCIIVNVGNIRPFPVTLGAVMRFAYQSERYLQKSPYEQMKESVLDYTKGIYGECAERVATIYVRFFGCSNFRGPQKNKAPFGYGEKCLGMYEGMWSQSYNQVLTEFRQSLYMHEVARKYIKVLKGKDTLSEIWCKTVDDFNSVLYEDAAYLPELVKEVEALYDEIPARARDIYIQNVMVPISVINAYNQAMEHEGLSLKAYFAEDSDEAVAQMQKALEAMKIVYDNFQRAENSKWQTWYKNECLACYAHTHDLIACTLSLLRGEGEILVRPFVDFAGHNKHVSLYQYKRGNENFPFLYSHPEEGSLEHNLK